MPPRRGSAWDGARIIPDYKKDSWGEQVTQILRDAAKNGENQGDMTSADIVLAVANADLRKFNPKSINSALSQVKGILEKNGFKVFAKVDKLTTDPLKPQQQLYRLVPNADTSNVPDTPFGPFIAPEDIGIELWRLSSFVEPGDVPVGNPEPQTRNLASAHRVNQVTLVEDDEEEEGEIAMETGTTDALLPTQTPDTDMGTGAGDTHPIKGTKRQREEDNDGGDRNGNNGSPNGNDENLKSDKRKKTELESARARHEREAIDASREREKAHAEKAEPDAREAERLKAAEDEAARIEQKRAEEEEKEKERIARDKRDAAEKERIAKDLQLKATQEKLQKMKQEKEAKERMASNIASEVSGRDDVLGKQSENNTLPLTPADAAKKMWEDDAMFWADEKVNVDPDSGKRRLFQETDDFWNKPVETNDTDKFKTGFVFVATDKVIDEVRRLKILGMPSDGAHVLGKKIKKDTVIFLCRCVDDSKGNTHSRHLPRVDLDVYRCVDLYPHVQKSGNLPPRTIDKGAFQGADNGGGLPAQIRVEPIKNFGVTLKGEMAGDKETNGLGVNSFRDISLTTDHKLRDCKPFMPALLKNQKRVQMMLKAIQGKARQAFRAKKGV